MFAPKSNYKSLIESLMSCHPSSPPAIAVTTLMNLATETKECLRSQDPYLKVSAPMTICGDIHGQLQDLLRVFKQRGTPPDVPYLFLGDYVDRGDKSIEVIALLFALKVVYPERIFLLRGNHECPETNGNYGFREECDSYVSQYASTSGGVSGKDLWDTINGVFQWMPLCASVEDRIFCVHGGLSPELKELKQLYDIDRNSLRKIPDKGLVCDLLWSDPDKNELEWGENERGCSYTFGPKIVEDFCEKHGFDLVCRAHQVMDHGYEFFCRRKLATVFTASNYCGDYGNRGSVLYVDPKLRCSLVVMLPNNEISMDDVFGSELQSGNSSSELPLGRVQSPPPTVRPPSPRTPTPSFMNEQ